MKTNTYFNHISLTSV